MPFNLNNSAKANPSPPLFPGPHTTQTLGLDKVEIFSNNTSKQACAAFCISLRAFSEEAPMERRSHRAICFAVSIFMLHCSRLYTLNRKSFEHDFNLTNRRFDSNKDRTRNNAMANIELFHLGDIGNGFDIFKIESVTYG